MRPRCCLFRCQWPQGLDSPDCGAVAENNPLPAPPRGSPSADRFTGAAMGRPAVRAAR